MNYYIVIFEYNGPKGLYNDKANALCWKLDKGVEAALSKKIETKHYYSFPDGSLSKYVRSVSSKEVVHSIVQTAINESDVKHFIISFRLQKITANSKPMSCFHRTVEELFNG